MKTLKNYQTIFNLFLSILFVIQFSCVAPQPTGQSNVTSPSFSKTSVSLLTPWSKSASPPNPFKFFRDFIFPLISSLKNTAITIVVIGHPNASKSLVMKVSQSIFCILCVLYLRRYSIKYTGSRMLTLDI